MRVEARDIGWGVLAGGIVLLGGALVSDTVKGRFFAYPIFQVGLSIGVASVVALAESKQEAPAPVDRFALFWKGKETLASRVYIFHSGQHLKVPKGDWRREVVPWFRRFHKLCMQGKLVPSAYLGSNSKQWDRYLCWLFHGRDLKSYSWEIGSDRRVLLSTLYDWASCKHLSTLSSDQRLAVEIASLDNLLLDFDRTLDEISDWFRAVPVESLALFVASHGSSQWEKLLGIVSYASPDQRCRFLAELESLLNAHWDEEGCRRLVILQYAYAIADFDLPLSLERFTKVVNNVNDKTWLACSNGLKKRMEWAKTYHEKGDLPSQAKKLIEKMWGKEGVPSPEDFAKVECPRLLK